MQLGANARFDTGSGQRHVRASGEVQQFADEAALAGPEFTIGFA